MNQLKDLYQWYENLSEKSLGKIHSYYTKDAFFKDPFNTVKGSEKIEHIFFDMFKQLEKPHFVFIDKIQQNDQAFATWNFIFTYKNKSYVIHGSSHLKINSEGLVVYHRDYWDVGEELLLKVPVIKNLYGILRAQIGSSSQ